MSLTGGGMIITGGKGLVTGTVIAATGGGFVPGVIIDAGSGAMIITGIGVATAGGAIIYMAQSNATSNRNKLHEAASKDVDDIDLGKQQNTVKENLKNAINGKTKKYIPKTGDWRPLGQTRSEWLKETGYRLRPIKKNSNPFQNEKSFDILDESGNIIGRMDRNYRVNNKAVPEHVHLFTDETNVHHWFND